MKLYHFLSAEHALDDLTNWHIRISLIDELNDPFELWCVAQDTPQLRQAMRDYKREMANRFGVLCFCRDWHNPVLWSHYADRHRGICLGFEVDERCVHEVTYVESRVPITTPVTLDTASLLLYTKYRDWSYEQEFRGWFSLETPDPGSGHYFYEFDDKIQLREVIAGPLCRTGDTEIRAAIGNRGAGVQVIPARLAFMDFRIVENLAGFRSLA